ncbi:uncharacterized protein LOC119180734 [Rhipicephalus microplus]|uniref:uncharacterized protein LOC119180734 n=1 Tax=Rhipicephalus microplus TaxID=6941 RepID=UPI003F6AC090
MSSYELPANACEDVLRGKIVTAQGYLRSLNLSNCIVAEPASLLSLVSDVKSLQTLSCIACPLKASLLLDRLLNSLPKVTQLQFSLVDTEDGAKEELLKIKHLKNVQVRKDTMVCKMYVEVAGDHNVQLLRQFLDYCPLLKDLHIHFLHEVSADLCAMTCTTTTENLQNLETFKCTSEALFTTQSAHGEVLDMRYCINLQGNVVFRKRSQGFNCAQLRNLAFLPNAVFPDEPVVLAAFDTPDIGRQFLIAGIQHNWSHIRSLCMLLYARNPERTEYPTISPRHSATLRDFFAALVNLVELNVSSFHFEDGFDITVTLDAPALQRLRALSLPPCGLRPKGAVRRLALGLDDIEDLDIRINLDGRHKRCVSCDNDLTIEPEDASVFVIESGRLTLSNVPNLLSLEFLRRFWVCHVRFIDDSDKPRFDFRALSNVLCSSRTLRSLVVRMVFIDFTEQSFETFLCPGSALERLCLLTRTRLPSSRAQMVVEGMASQLPSIFYIHIHYVDLDTGSETNMTWIRRPEGEATDPLRPGIVIPGKPCIMCSTQTFVALAKPLYRKLQ